MTPSGIEPATFRFVAQHLNHCATAVTNLRCRILNLAVVLCGCETWSLRQGKKHRLRMLENRELRKIFEPKGDVGT